MLLGNYVLEEVIHQTDRLAIQRARREDGTRAIAKVLVHSHPSAAEVARLHHEYAILQELDLPGVAQVLDLHTQGHQVALFLRDDGKTSLDRVLQDRDFSISEGLKIGVNIARVLRELHEKQVIHKDIKPANILVDPETLDVKLIDLGASTRLRKEHASNEFSRSLQGTLTHISPEQTGRMNRPVDLRADLYSLGVTLYQVFTGRLPFESDDPLELVHSHIARTPQVPSAIRPELPQVLSDLIMTLQAKAAEDRYQSARGLLADLERCAREWEEHDSIAPFALRQHDPATTLRVSQKLYGRAAASQDLLAAFERSSIGQAELVLVSGAAGTGKSALVQEMHKEFARRRCHFISGKFDQRNRNVPYASIATAFRELMQQLLALPEDALGHWKGVIQRAVEPNGQVLVDVIPELEHIIGSQPAVAPVGPVETQNRFLFVFGRFIQAIATDKHPLLIFLDDLQWADPASLRLLQSILSDRETRHLLVIGAFRDDEVSESHPFRYTLRELDEAGCKPTSVHLQPLVESDVQSMVSDSLDRPNGVGELATLVCSKTQGNPFYVNQFLETIYERNLLWFDLDREAWAWDLPKIEAAMVTDNVIDLMAEKIERVLSPAARETLQHAACIGYRFDLRTLAAVSERSEVEIAVDLWTTLREGLVLPESNEYRYTEHSGTRLLPDIEYRFLHDRVQQVAYLSIDPSELPKIHLRIGRALEKQAGEDVSFQVVDHLNLGIAEIEAPEDRKALAALNIRAAERAKASNAFNAAGAYLDVAAELSGKDLWTSDYEFAYRLQLLRAECAYLSAEFERADKLFDEVGEHAKTPLERGQAAGLRMLLYTNVGRFVEAKNIGQAALADLGVDLPSEEEEKQKRMGGELAQIGAFLEANPPDALLSLPRVRDPQKQLITSLLVGMMYPAYFTDPSLFGIIVVHSLNRGIEDGVADLHAISLINFAIFLAIQRRAQEAIAIGEVARKLAAQAEDRNIETNVLQRHAIYIQPLAGSMMQADRDEQRALALATELGNFVDGAYAAALLPTLQVGYGKKLDGVIADLERLAGFVRMTKNALAMLACPAFVRPVLVLAGRAGPALSDETWDEAAFLKATRGTPLAPALTVYSTAKLYWHIILGDLSEVGTTVEDAESTIAANPGVYHALEVPFLATMARAMLADQNATEEEADKAGTESKGASAEREQTLVAMKSSLDELLFYARTNPTAFEHKKLLVEAEIARLEGRELECINLYDRAAETARRHGNLIVEALASERAANYYLASDRRKIAGLYLMDARYAYEHWGSAAKVRQIDEQYSHLFTRQRSMERTISRSGSAQSTVGRGLNLDVTTAIRASQALSGELNLDKLVEQVLRVILQNAGAHRVVLLLERNESLFVEATIESNPESVQVSLGEVFEQSDRVPQSVVRYTTRTLEDLIVNLPDDERFASDTYFERHAPKSMLCFPMTHQARLVGALYLEHDTLVGAFRNEQIALLRLLASQAAIALENAVLYAEVRASNDRLEGLVEQRTQELSDALKELWAEMDLARKIQTVLLPSGDDIPGFDIHAKMVPASQVGGDYYDFIRAGDDSWVLIGDVSGHGVSAGLIMMMAQTAVRATVHNHVEKSLPLDPSSLLTSVNGAIWRNLQKIGENQYMTATALRMRGRTITHAGLHQDLLVYRAKTKTVEAMESHGLWLGISDDVSEDMIDTSFDVEPGDVILLFSDGITEAKKEQKVFGTKGLIDRFQSRAASDPTLSSLVDGLFEDIANLENDDDVTLVALRCR